MILNKLVFKPKAVQIQRKKTSLEKVIGRKLYCVCTEDENGSIFANVTIGKDTTTMPFTQRSDNLKGKTIVFTKFKSKFGNIVKLLRDKSTATHFPGSVEHYTIFRNNYVYSGYVVKEDGLKKFDVTDIEDHVSLFTDNQLSNKERNK